MCFIRISEEIKQGLFFSWKWDIAESIGASWYNRVKQKNKY